MLLLKKCNLNNDYNADKFQKNIKLKVDVGFFREFLIKHTVELSLAKRTVNLRQKSGFSSLPSPLLLPRFSLTRA